MFGVTIDHYTSMTLSNIQLTIKIIVKGDDLDTFTHLLDIFKFTDDSDIFILAHACVENENKLCLEYLATYCKNKKPSPPNFQIGTGEEPTSAHARHNSDGTSSWIPQPGTNIFGHTIQNSAQQPSSSLFGHGTQPPSQRTTTSLFGNPN